MNIEKLFITQDFSFFLKKTNLNVTNQVLLDLKCLLGYYFHVSSQFLLQELVNLCTWHVQIQQSPDAGRNLN